MSKCEADPANTLHNAVFDHPFSLLKTFLLQWQSLTQIIDKNADLCLKENEPAF